MKEIEIFKIKDLTFVNNNKGLLMGREERLLVGENERNNKELLKLNEENQILHEKYQQLCEDYF